MAGHPHKKTVYLPEWADLEALAAKETARIGHEVAAGTLVRRAVQALLKDPKTILKMTQPSPKD
jgi:hypothetical protein